MWGVRSDIQIAGHVFGRCAPHHLWNQETFSCPPTAASLANLETAINEAVDHTSDLLDTQKANLRVTQLWLRIILWQIRLHLGHLVEDAHPISLTYHYPLEFAKDLVLSTQDLSVDSIKVHGVGITEKLLDIACAVVDVLACIPLTASKNLTTQSGSKQMETITFSSSHESFIRPRMSLLSLPAEIQLCVLGFLGSGFFQEDSRRLTVSAQWHAVAIQVMFWNLQLTVNSLKRLTENEAALGRCRVHTRTVRLLFETFKGLSAPVASNPDLVATQISRSLLKLAPTLQQCRGLNRLELKALHYEFQDLEPQSRLHYQYLMPKPLSQLLTVQNLTSLRLDIAGSQISKAVPDIHLCASIQALMPSLRCLHCRMETICTSLLDISSIDQSIGLEELIINLSLSNLTDTWTAYRFPKWCQSDRLEGVSVLRNELEDQAAELASHLDTARCIRVISHTFPSLDWVAFDAVQGRRVRLEAGSEWDAQGETLEDTSSEDETDLFESEPDSPAQITL
ncbi:uncharacterized protein E0L32_002484 [Thyridium curvatum]|uniref:F-box domain-containing protein n=1 Tax=Thyridium curvatum TaxID=1093900 RepID=A0A507BFE0_9PEZI|nr:uncharacterized protein E0L32_002484 [Thyridium curvatum]TPX18627.1 hypothetical protein E0L32_002484 [Thyridium curvatum]